MRYPTFIWVGLSAAMCMAQQPFGLDTTFRTTIASERISSLLPLPDGRILVSGKFEYPGAQIDLGVGRLNANGTWDESYLANNWGQSQLVQWEDKVYTGLTGGVRRLFANGDRDWSFYMEGEPLFSSGQLGNYHVYPDGRVLICGDHLLSDTVRGFVGYHQLIWFTNTGRLDTTRTHRACDGFIYRIFPLPDGKFLLSGSWTAYDGHPTPNSTRLIRVFADGSLDTTFQAPFDFGRPSFHLPLADGKHLVSGIFGFTNDEDTLQIARLLPDGALDSSFVFDHQLLRTYDNDPPFTSIITIAPIGPDRYAVTGSFTRFDGEPRGGIAALDTSGHLLDDVFGSGGCGVWNDGFQDQAFIWALVPAPDGSYYVHGSYHGYDDGVVNDTAQRMVSRLYALDVGVPELPLVRPVRGHVRIQPNPAESYTTITYALPVQAWGERASIVVRDMMGKEQRRFVLAAAEGQLLWDTRGTAPGTYTVELVQSGARLATERVVVKP